jgi:hypothetical protein
VRITFDGASLTLAEPMPQVGQTVLLSRLRITSATAGYRLIKKSEAGP